MKTYYLNDIETDLNDILYILISELETEAESLESFTEETYFINGTLYTVGVSVTAQ